jgi:hypothetical protein
VDKEKIKKLKKSGNLKVFVEIINSKVITMRAASSFFRLTKIRQ